MVGVMVSPAPLKACIMTNEVSGSEVAVADDAQAGCSQRDYVWIRSQQADDRLGKEI